MRFTISEVAVDWQQPVVLRRYAALTDTGPAAADSKHTTALINHTSRVIGLESCTRTRVRILADLDLDLGILCLQTTP